MSLLFSTSSPTVSAKTSQFVSSPAIASSSPSARITATSTSTTTSVSFPFSFPSPSFSFSLPRTSRTLPFLRAIPPSSSGNPESSNPPSSPSAKPDDIPDEWGDKTKTETETESSYTKLPDSDPPRNEDEWGGSEDLGSGNGTPRVEIGSAGVSDVGKNMDLKRCLVDSVYDSSFGFRASAEVRAEVSELVNQLEAVNPTPNPTEVLNLLDGNWVLIYTAFSELLPLLAVGTTPLLKVDQICQKIDSSSSTIDNSTTLSSPFASVSFSASASFEVRSPSRIQVRFTEGVFNPPDIKSRIDLPDNVNLFGQRVSLSPVQQTLGSVQEAVAGISRALSGQPPLKVPIPGERTSSWLLITYLDEDLRISRGDGGIFVLAREGSSLLDQ